MSADYIPNLSLSEALHEDGFHSSDWHKELMMDDTHCFDCESRLEDCDCPEMDDNNADKWMVANFGEDGLQ